MHKEKSTAAADYLRASLRLFAANFCSIRLSKDSTDTTGPPQGLCTESELPFIVICATVGLPNRAARTHS